MKATSVDNSSKCDDAFSSARMMWIVNDNFKRMFLGIMSRARDGWLRLWITFSLGGLALAAERKP